MRISRFDYETIWEKKIYNNQNTYKREVGSGWYSSVHDNFYRGKKLLRRLKIIL